MLVDKQNNELIAHIPLTQMVSNPYDDIKREYPNLVGIIADNECTLSHLIVLDYKDSLQEGSPILYFETKEELQEICSKYNITIWEHPICAYCHKAIRGSFTIDKKGNKCHQCEQNK